MLKFWSRIITGVNRWRVHSTSLKTVQLTWYILSHLGFSSLTRSNSYSNVSFILINPVLSWLIQLNLKISNLTWIYKVSSKMSKKWWKRVKNLEDGGGGHLLIAGRLQERRWWWNHKFTPHKKKKKENHNRILTGWTRVYWTKTKPLTIWAVRLNIHPQNLII